MRPLEGIARGIRAGTSRTPQYSYAGKGDGLTSHLRLRFVQSDYVGIELEVNQSIVFGMQSAGVPKPSN